MKETEIKPCPNPKCGAACTTDATMSGTAEEMYYVECPKCQALGPEGKTESDAIRLHNAMPRREEIYKELMEIANRSEGRADNPWWWNGPEIYIDRIKKLAKKYAPEEDHE